MGNNLSAITHRSKILDIFADATEEFEFCSMRCAAVDNLFFKQIEAHKFDILRLKLQRADTLILDGTVLKPLLQAYNAKTPEIFMIDGNLTVSRLFGDPFSLNAKHVIHQSGSSFSLDTSIFNRYYLNPKVVNSDCVLAISSEFNVILLKRVEFFAICGLKLAL